MDILSLDHNFGKEIETSANQLFSFFCNNVILGQWQIAKTCLKQLIHDKKLLFVNFDSVFSSIIKHPEVYCRASLSIKSPFYFARLLCQTILEIYPDFLIENNLQDLIELRIIFYSHFDRIAISNCQVQSSMMHQFQVIKDELEEIVNGAKNYDSEIQLKSPTLEFIKNIIFNDILKAKNLLNLILLKNPNIEYCLIEFHLQLLSESLNTFEPNFTKAKDTLNESTSDIFSLINLLLIYKKLNSITFNSNRKFELIAMTQRFFKNTCFKLRETFGDNLERLELNITKLQLALLDSDKNSPLLELFTKINYEIDRQAIISNSFNDENLVVLSIIKHSLNNVKTEKILWKKLFMFTLVEKRCLVKSLIEESLKLISKNQLDFLNSVFSIRDFYFLKPIILLIGISKAKDVNSAKKLINTLSSNSSKETLVDLIGNFLKTHLDFINWFFQQNKSQTNEVCFKQLMKILHKHLPLNIINDYLNLNKIDYSEINKILCNTLIERDDFVETKCVRFIDEVNEKISPIQEKSLNIFNGFYCINQILRCILFCCEHLNEQLYQNLESKVKTRFNKAKVLKASGERIVESENVELQLESIKRVYHHNVTRILENVKSIIAKIDSADYRLEILENIYALIFVRSNDLFTNSEDESDQLTDDPENVYNPMILIESSAKPSSLDDFEIVEILDKETEMSIYENSAASLNQLMPSEALISKNSSDLNFDAKCKRARRSRHETNKDIDDCAHYTCKIYSKNAGGGDFFLANDFLCRDILLVLKECLNSYSSLDCKIDDDLSNVYSRSKKLLQLVNETLWRFQLIKPSSVSIDFGQISLLKCNAKCEASDCEQHLVYQFMKKRQRRDSNISSITNSIKNENLTLSLNRSFKNSDLKISHSHHTRDKRRSLESHRSLSLIYPQSKNKKSNSVVMKLLCDVKTLSVMCLKEFKSNEANQLVKMYSWRQDVANLFEFEQINFSNTLKNSIEQILQLDCLKSNETIHEQSLLSLSISKIIDNLTDGEKGKPLTRSILICDLLAILKIDINLVKSLIDFASFNLNRKVSEKNQNPDLECLDKQIRNKLSLYIDSISALELSLEKDNELKKEFLLDYITAHDGVSILPKNSDRTVQCTLEKVNRHLQLTSQIDLCLEELCLSEEGNLDHVYEKISSQLKSRSDHSFDILNCFVQKSKKTEGSKSNAPDCAEALGDTSEFSQFKKDKWTRSESICADSNSNYNYLMSFNDYTKTLYEYLKENSIQTSLDSNFSILDFSPASLICKLLFDDLLKPESIEPLTENLNLNLAAIILHNSCPRLKLISCENKSANLARIDKLKLMSNVSVYRNEFFYSILNENSVFSCSIKKPHDFVKHLLLDVLRCCQSRKNLSAKSLLQIYNSTDFKRILKMTQQLQHLNLDYLNTLNEKLSFFINLHNLLSIHANIFLLSLKSNKTKIGSKNASERKPLVLNDTLALGHTSHIYLHKNKTFKMLCEQKMCYKVGQMGCVSLFDLKHFILMKKKNENFYQSDHLFSSESQTYPSPLIDAKSSKKKSIFNRITPLKLSSSPKLVSTDTDHSFNNPVAEQQKQKPYRYSLFELDLKMEPLWSRYIPDTLDHRVMFALINCVQSDPPICVFDSDERLDDQLQMQMKNFLNQTVYADNDNEILYVPSLLVENLFCFSDHANSDQLSNFLALHLEHKNDGLENLVKFLVDQVNAELKENIKRLLNLDSIHCYGENIDQFGRKELPFPIIELKSSAKFCLVLDSNLFNDKVGWYKAQIEQLRKKEQEKDKGLENIEIEKETECSKKLLNFECLEYISKSSPLILRNLGFLFDIKIRDDFFTAMSEINVKNLLEYEQNSNNCKSNFLNRFIQLYVPLDYMNHLHMDLKLDMVTQFLLNSKTEEVKVENIIDLANYYSMRHEWKKVIDLLEDCTQDNEEFYDFRDLTQVNNLEISVQFITEINSLTINSKFIQKDIYNLFDHACLSFANQEARHFDKSYNYLFKINNFIRQLRAVFGLIDQWSIDGCLELIDFCIKKCQFFQLADLDSNEAEYLSSLTEILDDKKKEFTAYKDLILCAQNVLEKYYEHQQVQDAAGFYDSNNPISFSSTNELDANYNLLNLNKIKKVCQRCLTWQYAKAQLQASGHQDDDETRQLIMDLFLLNDKFVSAKYLIKKFDLDQKFKFKIEFGHLKFRLLNLNAVSSIIEIDLQSILKDCISFSKHNKPQHDFYLFNICFKLINELKDFNDLNNQVLISLSEFLIKNYLHLLNDHQLKELKVIQLTAKMFQVLVQDEDCVYFDSYKRHHSQPILIIEQLLMNAKIDVCAKTIKLSRDYLKDSKLNKDINALLVEYAHKALEFQIYRDTESVDNSEQDTNKSPNNLRSKMFTKPMSSIINTASSPSTNSILSNFKSKASLFEENSPKANNNFVMPIIPPNKEDWIKDEEVNDCMVCRATRFSLINRRHHCRRCGRVVCGACSQKSTLIQNVARRTCDDCFRQLEIGKENDQIVATEHEVNTKRIKRKSIVLTQNSSHEPSEEKMNYYLIGNNINETSVKRDEEVRENFRYSQAPSTSLCLSILDLHDNSLECGKSLLSLCDDLSLYLQNANQQEDHGLVINMIKHLLQNAKVKLLENSSSNIISLCDSYLSLIDVLEQLLLANCSIIPSLNELMNSESVRRIRNRLLEEERHELAMNLSTKCGLDTQTVWASWGLVELKRSNYKEARTKFEKCLKPLSEKNALNNSANLKILNDILTFFETTPPIRMIKNIKTLLSQPINIESLVTDPKMYPVGTNSLNNIEFEESIFYLETYGSHSLVVSFLQRNGFLKNAIEYLVEKKCNADIFVETILITSLRNGEFFSLIELMLNMDKFQSRLYPYYSAIGKFLEKNGFINTLYDFQIQMKDFVRSCMSCIYFFTKNAKTYSDLFDNLHYLNKARKHLEQYLEFLAKKQNILPNQSWKLKNDNNLRKQMSPQEIDSYIHAINLQIEVTKFICSYKKETLNEEKPSTLFSNNDAKISLCCQILMAGNSVQEGFGFVIRIIQCFNLSSTLVYTQISRELAKQFNFKEINNLLKCIDESGYKEDKNLTFDECISTCIRVFAAINNENCQNQTSNETNALNRHQQISKYSKEIESLIQLIKSDENKINAFILNGRLKSAYLIAIRLERVDIVKHITNVAERVGQNLIKDICIKWLEKNAK